MLETVHASTVAIGGRAVLLAGRSGAGKSDLALRLIDRGAILVADDYTRLTRRHDRLFASAPERIAGRMEVRGLGILTMPHREDVPAALLIMLDGEYERMPDQDAATVLGLALPRVRLAAAEASAALKVEHALALRGLR
jgi:serine kinase of HPr protein (carbohydrate metabolism regulator)